MLKLLIVDDERMPREILVNYIQWEVLGIGAVEEADDGVNAMSIVQKMQPDIIISDIKMPRMDGIELAAIVRKHLPNCKFIFLSGHSDKEYLKSAIKLKAVSYVEKPINLEEITEVLKSTVSECIEEMEKKEDILRLTEQKICLDLINTNADINDIAEKLSYIGKSFPVNCKYVTVIVKLNAGEQPDIKTAIQKLLESSLKHISSDYIMGLKEEDYCIIHFKINSDSFVDELKEIFENFICEAKQSLHENAKLFVGFGQETGSLNDLRLSYQTAVISIQKHFFKGYNKLIIYTEDQGNIYEFDEATFTLIDDYIRSGKQSEAEVLVKRLANDIRKHENSSPDYIRNIFYKIILTLSRLAEDMNISFFEDECKYILDTVSKANTLNEIETDVLQLIISISSSINSINDYNNDITLQITSCINSNFYDQALSVNSISQTLNLTPAYLCTVFKKDTGKTINQYITNVRVEKAKEYLKSQQAKIYDIARKVGYNDGKYFTKVFTKTVGINPKEYREIHCRDKENI